LRLMHAVIHGFSPVNQDFTRFALIRAAALRTVRGCFAPLRG